MLTLSQRALPTRIQHQLASVYSLGFDFDVSDFVVPKSLVGAPSGRQEQLLVADRCDGGVDVSLVLDDALLTSKGLSLDAFCAAAEGVSHLVYVAVACERRAQITALELELQAEIDKFALLVLGYRIPVAYVLERLFTCFVLDGDVPPDEQGRYYEANRLAFGFCRSLARLSREASTDAMLRDLRRVYRTRGAMKRDYVTGRAA